MIIFFFIVILILLNGKDRRNVIREMWLFNVEIFDVLVVVKFIIGVKELFLEYMKKLEDEKNFYCDILFFLEFKDVYKEFFIKVL